MAITPADIQAQTFSEAKRGYDPAEVDVFLETLSSEVDAMLAKIVDLKGRLTATEQPLADAQRWKRPRVEKLIRSRTRDAQRRRELIGIQHRGKIFVVVVHV